MGVRDSMLIRQFFILMINIVKQSIILKSIMIVRTIPIFHPSPFSDGNPNFYLSH